MTRFTQQTSWGRGEIEPKLEARQDADFYAAAARRLENFMPDTVGGIEVRAGFAAFRDIPRFVDLEDYGPSELIRTRQNLLGYIYRDVQVLIHAAVYLADAGTQHIVITPYRVGVTQLDTESPVDISTTVAVGSSYVTTPVETSSRTLFELGFAIAGPAAFITHELFPPLRVFPSASEVTEAVFNIDPIEFYQELFGFVTPTAGGTTWTGSEEAFFTEQLTVGDTVKFRGVLYTVATVSVDGDGVQSFTTDEAYDGVTLTDRVDRLEPSPFGGNPSLVAFYQSRLVYSRTSDKPTGVWLSRSNDPFTIVPSAVADDSPINAELFAEGADEFVWMTGSDRLFFGSSLGEYALGSGDETITPTSLRFFRIGNNGGAQVAPTNVDGQVVFVNRPRSQVLAVVFDFGRQAFNTTNMSLLAQHLTRDVVDLAFRPPVTNDRTPRIFALTAERELRAFALSTNANVAAWARVTHSPSFRVQAIASTSEFLFAVTERLSGKTELTVLRNE